MSREKILIVIGAAVLMAPWSGLPLAWLVWILPVLGLIVIGIGITFRSRAAAPSAPPSYPSLPPEAGEEPEPRSSHIAFS
jgi:cytochrome c-type biogenesis protein CcmH/NrfF